MNRSISTKSQIEIELSECLDMIQLGTYRTQDGITIVKHSFNDFTISTTGRRTSVDHITYVAAAIRNLRKN